MGVSKLSPSSINLGLCWTVSVTVWGYGLILVIVAFFRELLGSGTLYGFRIIPESWYVQNGGCYLNNGLMIMPAMALILVGLIIWVHRSRNKDLIENN